MVNNVGYHCYGAIINYDPNTAIKNKYSYTFMDSVKTKASHCLANMKARIENTFEADITIISKLKAFYN